MQSDMTFMQKVVVVLKQIQDCKVSQTKDLKLVTSVSFTFLPYDNFSSAIDMSNEYLEKETVDFTNHM